MEEKTQQKQKPTWLYIVIGIAIGLLVMAFFFLPLKQWYIESPGTASPLNDIVTVNGKKDHHKGSFMMTTVQIATATPFTWVQAHFDDKNTLISKDDLMGQDTSNAQYNVIQTYYMQTAQNNAEMMALKLAHQPYHMQYDGVYVMSLTKQSDFKGKLAVGDVVTKVNGKSFHSAQDMIKYIKSKALNDKVSVTFVRDGETHTVSGRLKPLNKTKQPGIGITLIDKTSIRSDVKIKVNVGDVGGPSAGMMFTLEMYEMLTGKDLRHGRQIAGTGEMLPNGEIGRIGGIDKKVIAAERSGATIFLAPDDTVTKAMKKYDPKMVSNYKEALAAKKKYHLSIKIVPVHTINDAIQYLEQ